MHRRLTLLLLVALVAACGPVQTPQLAPDPAWTTATADRSEIVADGTDAAEIIVVARASDGTALAGLPVSIAAPGADHVVEQPGTTDASGRTAGRVKSTKPGVVTLSITIGDAAAWTTKTVRLTFVQGPPTRLSLMEQPLAARADAALTPVRVLVEDVHGHRHQGVDVTLTLEDGTELGGTITRTTSANGLAIFDDLTVRRAGSHRLVVHAARLSSLRSEPFDVRPGRASAEHSTHDVDASPVADGSAIATISIRVRDAYENSIPGLGVEFGEETGTATLSDAAATTDADGLVAVQVRSTVAGPRTVTATLQGGAAIDVPVVFVPGGPSFVTSTIELPEAAAVSATETATVRVTLRDAHGNAVPGINVTASASGTGHQFDASSRTTDAAGEASFQIRSTRAGTKTVTATAGDLTLSADIDFEAGPASGLAFRTQPAMSAPGETLASVQVAVVDAFGNPTGWQKSITLELEARDPTPLFGTTERTVEGGLATFDDLVPGARGSFRLVARTNGLADVASESFRIAPLGWVSASGSLTDASPRAVALHPINPDTWWVGTGDGVFRTTDAGASWTLLADGFPIGHRATALALNPDVPETIVVGTEGPGGPRLVVSGDGGDSWTRIDVAATGEAITAVAWAGEGGSVLLAADGDAVYRSDDGGLSWSATLSGNALPRLLETTAVMPDFVFAAGEGVRISDDAGATWIDVSTGLCDVDGCPVSDLAIAGSYLFAARSGSGLFRLPGGEDEWTRLTDTGLASAQLVVPMPVGPGGSGLLASDGRTLVQSSDAGDSWTLAMGLPGETSGIEAAPSLDGLLFVGERLWWLGLDDEQFVDVSHALAGTPTALVPGAHDDALVAANADGAVQVTTDAGRTWQAIARLDGLLHVATTAADPDVVYALTREWGVVHRSDDGGRTWRSAGWTSAGEKTTALVVSPANPRLVYRAFDGGLDWSDDGGESFSSDFQLSGSTVAGVFFHPAQPSRVYVLANGTLLESNPAFPVGPRWLEVATVGNSVSRLAFDPRNTRVIYAARQGAGVQRSSDGGRTWRTLNDGLSAGGDADVAVDAAGSAFAVSGGRIHRLDPSDAWRPAMRGLPPGVQPQRLVVGRDGAALYVVTDRGVFVTYSGGL